MTFNVGLPWSFYEKLCAECNKFEKIKRQEWTLSQKLIYHFAKTSEKYYEIKKSMKPKDEAKEHSTGESNDTLIPRFIITILSF